MMDTLKLRQKLLDLAIRGKLVPQDPNDEPASVLLERIHAEKVAMVERGELKPRDIKGDTVIFIGSDGLPYEKGRGESSTSVPIERALLNLPSGWSWARLRTIASVEAGKTPSKDAFVDDGIPYFKMYNLRNQRIDFDFQPQYIKPEVHFGQLAKSRIRPGDLIMNIVGPPLGKLAIAPETFPEANTNQAAVVIRSYAGLVPIIWLFYYLSEMSEIDSVSTRGSAGQVNISVNQSRDMIIPIPPLAEQRRIVEALDKYLALVDEIEQAQADLDALFAQLKSKVLDLAIRGELTAQDPDDEPASVLLERIHAEKVAMVKRGELKPKDIKGDTVIFTGSDGLRYEKPADGKGEAKRIEVEIPFEIPEGWSWARLGQLVATCGGKTPSKANKEFWEGGGVPWMTSKDMKAPELFGSQIELTESGAAETNIVPAGSVLMVVRSGILRRLLPVAINRVETTINQDLKAMTPYDPRLSDWLLTCFNAWDERIRDIYHKDGTTVDSIEFDAMLSMLLPVPPLAEQRHIVEAIKTAFNFTNL